MIRTTCPQCQQPVTAELPGGLCPTCLMAVAASISGPNATGSYPQSDRFRVPSITDLSIRFPELEILELIGHGGMGAVYRVRQKNLDRIVALKIFLAPADDLEFAARFQREARVLAKLNHPNIVTVHDFGVRSGTHFLIMEFVDGMNLRQLSSVEKIQPELALQMVPQLCDALQYAHDQGIIHRDIKPENLLITKSGGIKIADFGLAKIMGGTITDSLTRTQQVMGTLNYMAPEQRERPTQVDHRADIYSLGVVIYELLTGELPLGRFQPPSRKSDLDARLDEAVMRALEREPERRYQQASEFKSGMSSQLVSAAEVPAAAMPAAEFYQPNYNPPRPPVKSTFNYDPAAERNDSRGWMLTLMSGRERKGNWNPGSHQTTITIMGGVRLDLTQVTAPEVSLTMFALMGGSEVIVRPGTIVELGGMMVMGTVTDKIEPSADPTETPMLVRVQAWGAMGECKVRTPKVKKSKRPKWNSGPPQPPTKLATTSASNPNGTALGRGLVLLYRMFALLVTLAIPIVFLAGAFELGIGSGEIPMTGVLVALAAWLIWAELKYIRVLVRGGAGTESSEDIESYQSATWIGSLIRSVALLPAFACPMLLVISQFEVHSIREIKFAAVVCAIASFGLFKLASYAEEFLFGNQRKP